MNFPAITDHQRLNFMTRFVQEVRKENGLQVTPFEFSFSASFAQSSRQSLWFTANRRPCVDRIWMNYGALMDMPFPALKADAARAPLPQADAGCCMYLVFDDSRRQRPCNEPAAFRNYRGFLYCKDHAELAQKALARRGGRMELHPYKS
jgi:hypothetical protein